MSVRAIIDSDVLVDFLQGVDSAREELNRYSRREISIVSWMDILCGAWNPDEEKVCRQFLATFETHPLTADVAEEAVRLRRHHRIRLPEAVVWATARTRGALLVTRNTRDFPRDDPGVRVPYRL